jgi:hypothetical protein
MAIQPHGRTQPVKAQVVSLKVRPSQVSHLCFEVGGILETLKVPPGKQTLLGQHVTSYPFEDLYKALGSNSTTGSSDQSRLFYSPDEIRKTLIGTHALASLRAEDARTALKKAINARQNAYYAKYGSIQSAAIIEKMNEYYSPTTHDSKPYRLGQLKQFAENQVNALKAAYSADGTRNGAINPANPQQGVVKTTSSLSTTTGGGSSVTGQTQMVSEEEDGVKPFELPNLPPGGAAAGLEINADALAKDPNATIEEDSTGQTITNTGAITQKITNTDYGYRIPWWECQAQYQRAQISLIDQQFAQFMYSVNFPNLKQVFENELNNIDCDIYRLQIAYANTMLMTPISGTVTGVYKNPGDAVRAGEPVIRVENDDTIFLVGTLICPALIQIGSSVTVSTTLFGSDPASPALSGTVVAARGHVQENEWGDPAMP